MRTYEDQLVSISQNVFSEAWMNEFKKIFTFINEMKPWGESTKSVTIQNDKFVQVKNAYYSMKELQKTINDNDGILDWFKYFSNEVIDCLDSTLINVECHLYEDCLVYNVENNDYQLLTNMKLQLTHICNKYFS